jgi:shikimate kinase / 3-dehydroquinate synthase
MFFFASTAHTGEGLRPCSRRAVAPHCGMRASPANDSLSHAPPRAPSVVLCGFMATGKTTVGQLLARRLDTTFRDADAAMESRLGLTVTEIFARHGEAAFRAAEREVCRELAEAGGVVGVGGGAVVEASDRAALARRGTLVCLEADEPTLAARLEAWSGRPLADSGGWRELLAARRPAYDAVALRVQTVGRRPEAVVDEVLVALGDPVGRARRRVVPAPDGEYGVLLGAGLLGAAGRVLREHGLPEGRAVVVTDAAVAALHGPPLLDALAAAGWEPAVVEVPRGDTAKSLDELARLYDALADRGLGRDGVVLGLGGGAVGDLAGFAAATYLRGIAYVAVPTTLLAMVDAAIGGKTGVNLSHGKNLVGSFTSPRLVLADVKTLTTLPAAEWRAGLAEVVKHALIGDAELLHRLETDPPSSAPGAAGPADAARPAEPGDPASPVSAAAADPASLEAAAALVDRAMAVKIDVVTDDFREQGRREILNLGHTFAHGFERASGWRVRHGEAVSVGLVAACRAAAEVGLAEPSLALRVERLLTALGLPARLELDADEVLAAMAHDKKRRGGRLRLVLPERPGSVVLRPAPDQATLRAVLDSVLGHG